MSVRTGLVLLAMTFVLSGCEWFSDFKRQPSLWTWEPVKDTLTPSRGNPQMSVPTTGTAVAGFQVSYGAFPATIDSMVHDGLVSSFDGLHMVQQNSKVNREPDGSMIGFDSSQIAVQLRPSPPP